jgi:hypothetical protein
MSLPAQGNKALLASSALLIAIRLVNLRLQFRSGVPGPNAEAKAL